MMKQENKKYVFFDFCETLADFQTADAFVDFVRNKGNYPRMYRFERLLVFITKLKIIKLLRLLTMDKIPFRKRLKLYQLKGISERELTRHAMNYYAEMVRPHLIKKIVDVLQQKQREGCAVGLVSGGYSIYLDFFVKEYGLDFCHACKIGFRNGACTGKIVGMECMRENKVKILERYAESEKIKRGSMAYSDSISDLPLLRWVDTGVVVSRRFHQVWVDKYNLKELIWE